MGAIFDQNYTIEIICLFVPTFAIFRQKSLSFAHWLTEVVHFIGLLCVKPNVVLI